MLRQHVPQQPPIVALLAANGTRYFDWLLRHVRVFRVCDGGWFALVPGEPCLVLEDAMALLAYKFLLLMFLLLCLAIVIRCILSLRGASRLLLLRVFLYHAPPQPSVSSVLLRTPWALERVSVIVRAFRPGLCWAFLDSWHRIRRVLCHVLHE
ncbi:hypothetical protein TRVL_08999 [Trypanosoma vivax]|nr:hypothetical protein TRVL_08999 [Trypanosoma vivax]